MVEALTIVLTVGLTRSWRSARWGVCAALGALAVIVAGLGPALASLPIEVLKFGVGVMLTAFGAFWSGEGAGVAWPGADASLLGLVVAVAAVALGLAWLTRRAALTVRVAG